MQSVRIPQLLRQVLEREAARFGAAELASAAELVSRQYRRGLAATLERPVELAAYLVTRLPATYGALDCAFREIDAKPLSHLDLGAGPGTAALAAAERWGELRPVTMVEQNGAWDQVIDNLGLSDARRVQADLTRLPDLDPHDLVTLSYSLGEVPPRYRANVLTEAWHLASETLVLVEPGTPEGFEVIRVARGLLIGLGARIQAPCPHEGSCPMAGTNWCHFAVRVERTRAHRLAKGGELSYEDEKFCYLVARRREAHPAAARILRHPRIAPGLIRLELCTPDGLRERPVRKSEKEAWRRARKVSWGERYVP